MVLLFLLMAASQLPLGFPLMVLCLSYCSFLLLTFDGTLNPHVPPFCFSFISYEFSKRTIKSTPMMKNGNCNIFFSGEARTGYFLPLRDLPSPWKIRQGVLCHPAAVMDPDTPAENLTITVATPDSGFLALAFNLSHPVSSFTQADINNKRLYFTHTGMFQVHCTEK